MPSIEFDGLEVSVYRSERDDSLVVDIIGPLDGDLDENGVPKLRVWLNEARLYEHPRRTPLFCVFVENDCVGSFEDEQEALAYCEVSKIDPVSISIFHSPEEFRAKFQE